MHVKEAIADVSIKVLPKDGDKQGDGSSSGNTAKTGDAFGFFPVLIGVMIVALTTAIFATAYLRKKRE